eukprot:scaffold631_cov378-Prasinococcus_capsulatus_cf.AAC.26
MSTTERETTNISSIGSPVGEADGTRKSLQNVPWLRSLLTSVLLTALMATLYTVYWENVYEQRVAARITAHMAQADSQQQLLAECDRRQQVAVEREREHGVKKLELLAEQRTSLQQHITFLEAERQRDQAAAAAVTASADGQQQLIAECERMQQAAVEREREHSTKKARSDTSRKSMGFSMNDSESEGFHGVPRRSSCCRDRSTPSRGKSLYWRRSGGTTRPSSLDRRRSCAPAGERAARGTPRSWRQRPPS